MQDRAVVFFQKLQDEICAALEVYEPEARFRSDAWVREGGGGGDTRVLEGGAFLEKGGVNTSIVHGNLPEKFAETLPGEGTKFWASGISLVLHPRNPYVPTTHANFRMIVKGEGEGQRAWFGGGADLTPYYPYEEDAQHFHKTLKAACDAHDPAYYPKFKKWCDDYFYLPHRKECRGVGGIFYDHLMADEHKDEEALFAFVQDAGNSFLKAYMPIVERRHEMEYGERQLRHQAVRRGRYVEFNLMYDRGTIFGLKTNGRVESILMSLPLSVSWTYDYSPEPGSPEAEIFDFITPRDWAGEG